MSGYELRAIGPDEVEAYLRAVQDAFHEEPHPENLALWAKYVEPERTLAAFHAGRIVATSAAVSFGRLTIPRGHVPLAGISAIGVHAVHRGRGLLDRMMRGLLEAIHERDAEAISGLWASEAGIYGRYGYGVASREWSLSVRSPEAHLRTPAPEQRPRAGTPAELLDDIRTVHETEAVRRVGMIDRDALGWEGEIADFEHERDGAGRLRALVWDGPDGPAGYALYAVRKVWADHHADDVVQVQELVALTPDAARALWEHLLRLSLSRRLTWEHAPEDEALPHLLTDPRAVGGTLRDGLFVRLVDVSRALAQRRYATAVDVVFEIADDVCPWNAGRRRLAGDLSGAECDGTSSAADLSLDVTELGAAYLGGTTLAALAAAGRVTEHTPGALAAASRAFRGLREPWTPDQF